MYVHTGFECEVVTALKYQRTATLERMNSQVSMSSCSVTQYTKYILVAASSAVPSDQVLYCVLELHADETFLFIFYSGILLIIIFTYFETCV